jgi:SAM-dependent methyltransferase
MSEATAVPKPTIPDSAGIARAFVQAREKDKERFIRKWLVTWQYQEIRKKRNIRYDEEIISDFFDFKGPEELVKWMNWFTSSYPDYIRTPELGKLVAQSRATDQRLLQQLNLDYDFSRYDDRAGVNNAHDFLLPQAYPVPERYRIRNVLDFGAGYGRQANLWTANGDITYVGMDAIETSYCLQHLYYSQLPAPLTDYIQNPEGFRFEKNKPGIYHVPTWRTDLIPDGSLDLVMCVQVLPELNPKLVRFMMRQFYRMLKPGAALYIRDNAYSWKPTGEFSVEKFLARNGFVLEYRPHVIDNEDIHGVPRIWRKTDPKVEASQTRTFNSLVHQMKIHVDTITRGRLRKFMGKKK